MVCRLSLLSSPQTHLGRYSCISTQPRPQPGHTEAKEKDPIIPGAEGLDPLFPGNIGVQENTNGL